MVAQKTRRFGDDEEKQEERCRGRNWRGSSSLDGAAGGCGVDEVLWQRRKEGDEGIGEREKGIEHG